MRYLLNVVTLSFEAEKCTGCGRCWEVCPHGVFVSEGKKARLTDRDLCMECGACAANCRYGAIQVRSGVGCAATILKGALDGAEPSCACGGGTPGCCS